MCHCCFAFINNQLINKQIKLRSCIYHLEPPTSLQNPKRTPITADDFSGSVENCAKVTDSHLGGKV